MGLIIGTDEAGYGPNLGPLVIGLTCWEVPGDPSDFDLWEALSDVVSESAAADGSRIQIADSKAVFTRARGLSALETGVSAALGLAGQVAGSWSRLRAAVHTGTGAEDEGADAEWYDGYDPELPASATAHHIETMTARWQAVCAQAGISLQAILCDVMEPPRFNRLVRSAGSKGVVLSQSTLRLIRRVWQPESDTPVLVVADKHGGRNRYDELISEVLDDQFVFRLTEGREISRYRVHRTQLQFQMKAERHLPVALASMLAKYVREMSMQAWNAYWQRQLPGLQPTQGYPVDAARFRQQIEQRRQQLGVDLDQMWREK